MSTLFLALEGYTAAAFCRARASGALPSLDRLGAEARLAGLGFPLADARAAMLVSAMTGAWPDQHGILMADTGDPVARTLRPVTPADLFSPPFWESLDAIGVDCLSVGWPIATTGRTLRSGVVAAGFGQALTPDFVSTPAVLFCPASLAETLADCMLLPEELDAAHLEALAPGWGRVDHAIDPRPSLLALAVAENVSRHAAFLSLLSRNPLGFATLCLSLPGELASLERAGAEMADGLFDGLADRGAALLDALLSAILTLWPAEGNVIIAGIPHAETPQEPGFVLAAGPAWTQEGFPRGVDVTELAMLVWGACGFARAGGTGDGGRSFFHAEHSLCRFEPPPSVTPDHTSLLVAEEQFQKMPGEDFSPGEQWHLFALSVLGRSLMARGDWAEASLVFEARLRLLPLDREIQLLLSECRQRTGRLEEALDAAYAAIQSTHGSDPFALLRSAELEALSGRVEEARKLLRRAEPDLPAFPQSRILHANVLIFLRDWPAAEALLKRLVEEAPEDGYLRYRLARCHLARGDWQAAFEHGTESLRRDPSRALAHELVGHSLAAMGLLGQAQTAFEVAAGMEPHWPRPRAALVRVAQRLQRPAEEITRLRSEYHQIRDLAMA